MGKRNQKSAKIISLTMAIMLSFFQMPIASASEPVDQGMGVPVPVVPAGGTNQVQPVDTAVQNAQAYTMAAFLQKQTVLSMPAPVNVPDQAPQQNESIFDIRTVEELIEAAKEIVREHLGNPDLEVTLKEIKSLPFDGFGGSDFDPALPLLPRYSSGGSLVMEYENQLFTIETSLGKPRLTRIETHDEAGRPIKEEWFYNTGDGSKIVSKYERINTYDDQGRIAHSIQTTSHPRQDGNWNVTSIYETTNEYDDWGVSRQETVSKRGDGSISFHSVTNYARDGEGRDLGHKNEWTAYDTNGKVIGYGSSKREKAYDESGNLTLERVLAESTYNGQADGSETTLTLTYNEQGKLTEDRTVSTYDYNARKNTHINFHKIEYDPTGVNAIREIWGKENAAGSQTIWREILREFTFNAQGRITSEKTVWLSNGKKYQETVTEFQYDKEGKIKTKKIVTSSLDWRQAGEVTYQTAIKEWFNRSGQITRREMSTFWQKDGSLTLNSRNVETFTYREGHLRWSINHYYDAQSRLVLKVTRQYDIRFSAAADSLGRYSQSGMEQETITYYSVETGKPTLSMTNRYVLDDTGKQIEHFTTSIQYHANGKVKSRDTRHYGKLIGDPNFRPQLRLLTRDLKTYDESGNRTSSLWQRNTYDEHGVLEKIKVTTNEGTWTDEYKLDAFGQFASVKRTVRNAKGKLTLEETRTVEYERQGFPFYPYPIDDAVETRITQNSETLSPSPSTTQVSAGNVGAEILSPPYYWPLTSGIKSLRVQTTRFNEGGTVKDKMDVTFEYIPGDGPIFPEYYFYTYYASVDAHVKGSYTDSQGVEHSIDTIYKEATGQEAWLSSKRLVALIRLLLRLDEVEQIKGLLTQDLVTSFGLTKDAVDQAIEEGAIKIEVDPDHLWATVTIDPSVNVSDEVDLVYLADLLGSRELPQEIRYTIAPDGPMPLMPCSSDGHCPVWTPTYHLVSGRFTLGYDRLIKLNYFEEGVIRVEGYGDNRLHSVEIFNGYFCEATKQQICLAWATEQKLVKKITYKYSDDESKGIAAHIDYHDGSQGAVATRDVEMERMLDHRYHIESVADFDQEGKMVVRSKFAYQVALPSCAIPDGGPCPPALVHLSEIIRTDANGNALSKIDDIHTTIGAEPAYKATVTISSSGRLLQVIFETFEELFLEVRKEESQPVVTILHQIPFGEAQLIIEKVVNPDASEHYFARVPDPVSGTDLVRFEIEKDFTIQQDSILWWMNINAKTVDGKDLRFTVYFTLFFQQSLGGYYEITQTVPSQLYPEGLRRSEAYVFTKINNQHTFLPSVVRLFTLTGQTVQTGGDRQDSSGNLLDTTLAIRTQTASGAFNSLLLVTTYTATGPQYKLTLKTTPTGTPLFDGVVTNVIQTVEASSGLVTMMTAKTQDGREIIVTVIRDGIQIEIKPGAHDQLAGWF